MVIEKVKEILNCKVIYECGELKTTSKNEKLNRVIDTACASDLMSDILSFGKPGSLLLTGLANSQSVQTADIMDVQTIVYVRGKKPKKETIKLAKEKGITLLSTKLLMYNACGKLYLNGLGN